MKKTAAIALLMVFAAGGCGLFGKKKSFEDSDTYRELINSQRETDKKIDSIRNKELRKTLDSLMIINDSLGKEVDKSMQKIKKDQEELNRKLNKNK